MKELCLSIFTFFITLQFYGQEKILPAEAKPFVPDGLELLDYIKGDLNGDKKIDAILVLKDPAEDTSFEEMKRPLLLLIRQSNGKLKQAARNDDAIMCKQCGGVFGDPYEGIEIKPLRFEISFYGGSNWRWAYTYTFNYNAAKKTWLLSREKEVNFNTGDPENTTKESLITASELGEISIEKFNSAPVYEDVKWKVIASKTYFYDSPIPGSKPRKAYMVKGDVATGIRQLKNFIQVSFDNGKDEFTDGYILRKDLQLIK